MVIIFLEVSMVGCHLIGADWNHGISHDFPRKYWEWKIIPTDELHHFSEGSVYHQPDNIDVIFLLEPSIMINHGWLPQTSHFSLSAEALTPNIWVVIRSAIYWQKNHQNIWGNHQKISKSSKQIIGQKIKKSWKCSPLGNPMKSLFLGWDVGVRWITMGSSSSRWNHGNHGARRMGLSHDLQMVYS